MSKQYMALCPPIYALCPSFCNVVKRYVLSNLDATSHWISAYLNKYVSFNPWSVKPLDQYSQKFCVNEILLSTEAHFRAIIFCYPWNKNCAQPTFATCEYLVGKDILWNLDSEYLRSVRHKIMQIRWFLQKSGIYMFNVLTLYITPSKELHADSREWVTWMRTLKTFPILAINGEYVYSIM